MCESIGPFERSGEMLSCATCNTSFGIGKPAIQAQPDRYGTITNASARVSASPSDLSNWLPKN